MILDRNDVNVTQKKGKKVFKTQLVVVFNVPFLLNRQQQLFRNQAQTTATIGGKAAPSSLTQPLPPQRHHPLLGPTSTRSSYRGATA